MKKIISCVAAAAIVMSCFSACGSNARKTTVETKVGEIKITYFLVCIINHLFSHIKLVGRSYYK